VINWLKYRKIYLLVSTILIMTSVYGLFNWKLKLGVDFTGGTIIEYRFPEEISTEEVTKDVEEIGVEVTSIQTIGDKTYLFRLPPINQEQKNAVFESLKKYSQGEIEELRYESVGPSIGPELVKKTIYAVLVAAGCILIWVAIQFKSFKYGISAILAMFHDSFILIGSFSLLGQFVNVEADFLFVTALLTTLSFSVHDTIVVFDRIREISKTQSGELYIIANQALTETMVRSLNNSFTIMFMLIALVLLGGTTVKWFAVALLIGTLLGTYSSPFVATPLLVTLDELSSISKERKWDMRDLRRFRFSKLRK